ncbi:class II aldolase/adducin family protein [Pleomorphochaeta sp. DL1XJH-081]|uniref:class II aldolase/adducin family protein n=1 Tax=Pleomorphochaeta sp. DL1XJH-081 TaxID=3409690 RepID=UPI003BB532F4
MDFSLLHPADQLVMIMNRIYTRGMTTTSGGNLSIRDNSGDVWITPAGIDKGTLTRGDIVRVRKDGTVEGEHAPSSELPFHMAVYRSRPDLHAVLHAHPHALVAFSIVRKLPSLSLFPSVGRSCKGISLAAYDLPGSDRLGEKIANQFAAGSDIVLLENHGLVIGGESLFRAFMIFETLESSARLETIARRLGTVRELNPSQLSLSETRSHLTMDDIEFNTRSTEELAARRDMVTLIQRSYTQGLFNATNGTYSVRLSDGSVLITPYNKDRAYVQVEDIVRVKDGMKERGKTPSRAILLHERIYSRHPDIKAILVAHPIHLMAFAVTDAVFDPRTIPESYILLREIQKIPFETIYQDIDKIADLINQRTPALLVENDSIITTGNSLLQAFDRLEVAEATATSLYLSHSIGDVVHIKKDQIKELNKAFGLN